MENGHRNSGFSHEKWWIFPLLCKRSPEGSHGGLELSNAGEIMGKTWGDFQAHMDD